MAANANVEVNMRSAMETISTFSLSCNQNCTSKCSDGGQKERFRRTVDSMGRTAEAEEGVRAEDSIGADMLVG